MNVLVVGGIFREVLDADTQPQRRYGGSGLTASVAAARFGAQVALASYVGSDDERGVRAELELAGVNDCAVVSVDGACGTFVYPTRQGRGYIGPMYRPAEALPNELPAVSAADTDIVLVFGIPDFDPVTMGWLRGIGHQTTVIWDRQGWLSRARDAKDVLKLSVHRRVYLANEGEALEDAQVSSFDEVLSVQPPVGFDVAVIKRGEIGVLVFERSSGDVNMAAVPSFPVKASFTVGSGDVFAGVFAARLALGDSATVAATWGCAAACVALRGCQNLLPAEAYGEASELISSFGGLLRRMA